MCRLLKKIALLVAIVLFLSPSFGRADEGKLSLSNVPVTDKVLAAFENMDKIKSLDISGTKVTDAGLQLLAKNFPNLTQLSLDRLDITDAGLLQLKGLKKLYYLDISCTKSHRRRPSCIERSAGPPPDPGLRHLTNRQRLRCPEDLRQAGAHRIGALESDGYRFVQSEGPARPQLPRPLGNRDRRCRVDAARCREEPGVARTEQDEGHRRWLRASDRAEEAQSLYG